MARTKNQRTARRKGSTSNSCSSTSKASSSDQDYLNDSVRAPFSSNVRSTPKIKSQRQREYREKKKNEMGLEEYRKKENERLKKYKKAMSELSPIEQRKLRLQNQIRDERRKARSKRIRIVDDLSRDVSVDDANRTRLSNTSTHISPWKSSNVSSKPKTSAQLQSEYRERKKNKMGLEEYRKSEKERLKKYKKAMSELSPIEQRKLRLQNQIRDLKRKAKAKQIRITPDLSSDVSDVGDNDDEMNSSAVHINDNGGETSLDVSKANCELNQLKIEFSSLKRKYDKHKKRIIN